jgi:uncharacterized cupredoxin-like copper-binding protein
MRRPKLVTMALVLGAALVVACSSDNNSSTNTNGGGGGVTVPAATGAAVSLIAGDKSDTEQFFTLTPTSATAGAVTFTFQNTGTRQHEMVVLKTDTPYDQLPVGTDNKVSEDASVGEISETDPGKTVTQTFDLAAGNYVLVCNIEKHYQQGMRVAFTVTP